MIGETISHYKIFEKLGEGGMGVVYKAEDTKLKRTVALKFLSAQALGGEDEQARFTHEAQAAAALSHPNICTVFEIDAAEGLSFIAMEYVEGASLKDKIEAGPLKLDEVLNIALQVAEGLQEAHGKGIVHRDIKPANVMLTSTGQTKIMDFGLARSATRTAITKDGTTLGTFAYMSPEQTQGEGLDGRSDIWSLGVVLYEMITGKRPFAGDYEQAVVYSILNSAPEPLTAIRTGVPMDLERVVLKALSKDASERYQTASDLAADLRRIQKDMDASGNRSRPVITPKGAPGRGRKWLWIAVSVVAVAVLAFLFVRSHFLQSEERTARTAGSERKMLAVLPFENLGPPEDEYFADGVTEEITSRLAALPGLGVISRTSAFQYKDTKKAIKRIGEELGVDYVLEGTVRWDRSGDGGSRVRVTPQLIRVSDDTHLWSERYDKNLQDIFEVQSQIAEQVFTQLDMTLNDPQRQNLEYVPTDNLEAYNAYLRGLDYVRRPDWKGEDFELARQMFERAIELDPGFALAHVKLSQVHALLYVGGLDRSEARASLAKIHADRAAELQPELPEVHLALGYYYFYCVWENDKALEEFRRARAGLPNDATAIQMIGFVLRTKGEARKALEYLEKALELDPQDLNLIRETASTYSLIEEYAQADLHYERCISLAPDQVIAYTSRVVNYWVWDGDLEGARATLEAIPTQDDPRLVAWWFEQELYERDYQAALDRLASTSLEIVELPWEIVPRALQAGTVYRLMDKPDLAFAFYDSALTILEEEARNRPDDFRIHMALGIALAGLDRPDEALDAGRLAVELIPRPVDNLWHLYAVWNLAVICTMVGDVDCALENVDRVLSSPSWKSVHSVRIDPRFDPLRGHPGYRGLLEKHGAADA